MLRAARPDHDKLVVSLPDSLPALANLVLLPNSIEKRVGESNYRGVVAAAIPSLSVSTCPAPCRSRSTSAQSFASPGIQVLDGKPVTEDERISGAGTLQQLRETQGPGKLPKRLPTGAQRSACCREGGGRQSLLPLPTAGVSRRQSLTETESVADSDLGSTAPGRAHHQRGYLPGQGSTRTTLAAPRHPALASTSGRSSMGDTGSSRPASRFADVTTDKILRTITDGACDRRGTACPRRLLDGAARRAVEEGPPAGPLRLVPAAAAGVADLASPLTAVMSTLPDLRPTGLYNAPPRFPKPARKGVVSTSDCREAHTALYELKYSGRHGCNLAVRIRGDGCCQVRTGRPALPCPACLA